MINVTAAVIVEDGRIFIARRSPGGSLPGKWEFPGGKIEPGETPEDCLERELYEEFGIDAAVGDFFAESIYHYERKSVRLLAFRVTLHGKIDKLNAHDDARWVPVEDLLDYDLAPADVAIAREIRNRRW